MLECEDESNKGLYYFYLALISFNIFINIIGNIYVDVKSEKESKVIEISLEQYETMETDEAIEQVIKNLEQIKNNIIIFLQNTLLNMMVMIMISCIGFLPKVIQKMIEEFAYSDTKYSNYVEKIIFISNIVASVCIVMDIVGTMDEVNTYMHLMNYYQTIFNSLNGLNYNILNNFTF